MAEIGGIKPLWDAMPLSMGKKADDHTEGAAVPLFEDVFRFAIDNVKQTDKEKNEAQYLLATGQLDSPATFTIAMNKADISAKLLAEMRNRALDAYSELSRMNM